LIACFLRRASISMYIEMADVFARRPFEKLKFSLGLLYRCCGYWLGKSSYRSVWLWGFGVRSVLGLFLLHCHVHCSGTLHICMWLITFGECISLDNINVSKCIMPTKYKIHMPHAIHVCLYATCDMRLSAKCGMCNARHVRRVRRASCMMARKSCASL
jgi:hypothetical protein